MYPFMHMESTEGFSLIDDEQLHITQYVEHSGFTALFKAWY